MNAFTFGQYVKQALQPAPTSAPAPALSPAQQLAARRVAEAKAMAAKVRGASGVPNATGNGAHQWSGRIGPGGAVSGARYSGPAPAPASAPVPALPKR